MRKQLKTEHQRLLPHFHHPGATYFVTSHLYGSFPLDILEKLKFDRDRKIEEVIRQNPSDKAKQLYLIQREYFLEYDDWLDKCTTGPDFLKDPTVAQIVKEAFYEYDGKYYRLIAFTLMPNHFHAILDFSIQLPKNQLFDIGKYTDISKVVGLIKGRSARFANLFLQRSGQSFWSIESYDRYIRNYRHYIAAVDYVKNNPVKAKICTHWMQHLHTWVRDDYQKLELMYPETLR